MLPKLLAFGLLMAGAVDPWRPVYHFTPERNWMNDPNGLVFDGREYHLFFQHNPFGNSWGHMSWGHAVSRDLLHWTHLPVALAEENGIAIFSGSAVMDGQRMVAIYTGNSADRQTQNIAFSEDRGRTWTKYRGNPVLDIGAKDFRDPKVLRYGNHWVMVVALPTEHKVSFYSSPDLIKWTHLSDFGPAGATGGVWECPDLFELDGRWVLVVNLNPGGLAGGSGGQYFVGSFDGTTFRPDSVEPQWIDYGKDMYATVSFFGTTDRRLWMGWMSNWQYAGKEPTTTWRTAQSLPREVRLMNGRLLQSPVREVEKLRGRPVPRLADFRGDSYEVDATLTAGASISLRVGPGEATVVGLANGQLYVDRTKSGKVDFSPDFAGVQSAPMKAAGPVRVRIFVDRSSIEVFGGDGEVVITDRIFPGPDSLGIEARGDIRELHLWPLAL